MRNTGVAYLLWCACFLGFCGVHRLYNGKYITGFIYLFTVGFFGIGQFIDLAFIPGMVEEKNLKYKLIHGSSNSSNTQSLVINLGQSIPNVTLGKTTTQKSDVHIILQLAKDHGGNISLADCVLATEKPVVEVKKTIENLCMEGLLEMGNHHDTGAIIYRIV